MQTINDCLSRLPSPHSPELEPPPYTRLDSISSINAGLAVESMKNHTSDEGWQIFAGLCSAGYHLFGHNIYPPGEKHHGITNVSLLIKLVSPTTLVLQDKREWDITGTNFRDPSARFKNVEVLKTRNDIFKLTILKDAHQHPSYHRDSADEIGCHAWIVYYHPRIVKHLAPYVRPQHLIRTYHTVDNKLVPIYSPQNRGGCLISGAVSGAYPLRLRLVHHAGELPETTYLPHPGYHRRGCCTPRFLQTLSKYKVAICTASKYGYAIRKIVEATACGCIVLTDLPKEDVLPEIDTNLVRVDPGISPGNVASILEALLADYNPERQAMLAEKAKTFYDYRASGLRLANDIEALRRSY